jgi:predicted nucleotidyltransferase
MEFDLKKHTIYYVRHGSHAYGTNTPESDEDFKGVAIAPMSYYLGGGFHNFEQAEKYVSKGHDKDEVVYDIRKFIKLAANANPNIIEVLFVDPSDIVYISDLGRKLREHSDLFVTKKIRHSMAGYAHDQAQRIKTHRSWLLDPPKKAPDRSDFGLGTTSKITPSEMGAYEHVQSKGEVLPEHVQATMLKEKSYASAKRYWDQYQDWKKNRNPARAILEEKYGFDTKHGYHLVRLMRMAKEILEGKGVRVKRKEDAEELLAIRNGAWSYDKLMETFDVIDADLDLLYKSSLIAHAPDFKKLDDLTMELIQEFHKPRPWWKFWGNK